MTTTAMTKPATTATTTAPTERENPFAMLIQRQADDIKALSDGLFTPDRVLSLMLLAARKNPQIAQCTGTSIVAAVRDSARLGLEPDGIHGALIPYRNKDVLELQFQPMYRGLMSLAYESGVAKDIVARVVYDCDEFDVEYGFGDPVFRHKPKLNVAKKVAVAYYAVAKLMNGGVIHRVMDAMEMEAHASKYSRNKVWTQHPVEMRLKTVLKKMLKWAPRAIKVVDALAFDDAIGALVGESTVTEPKARGVKALEQAAAAKALPAASAPPEADDGDPTDGDWGPPLGGDDDGDAGNAGTDDEVPQTAAEPPPPAPPVAPPDEVIDDTKMEQALRDMPIAMPPSAKPTWLGDYVGKATVGLTPTQKGIVQMAARAIHNMLAGKEAITGMSDDQRSSLATAMDVRGNPVGRFAAANVDKAALLPKAEG